MSLVKLYKVFVLSFKLSPEVTLFLEKTLYYNIWDRWISYSLL